MVAMPTVAIFPRKVRLDSCERGLMLESLFSVFGDSSREFSFKVVLSKNRSFCGSFFAKSFMWQEPQQRNAGKTLERRQSRKKAGMLWTQLPSWSINLTRMSWLNVSHLLVGLTIQPPIATIRRNPLVLVGFTSQTIGGQRLSGLTSFRW